MKDIAGFVVFDLVLHVLVALDCLANQQAHVPWVEPTTLSVTKLPFVFEDTLRWVPSPSDISTALTVTAWACAASCVTRGRLYTASATLAAASYSFAYFATALDSFQHKYFVSVVLLLAAFTRRSVHARQMLRYFVANLYFWTAITKVSDGGLFVAGGLLPIFSMNMRNHMLVGTVANALGVAEVWVWSAASVLVVGGEFLLAGLWATRRLPALALLVAAALHISIEMVGTLPVGLFAYYMGALHLIPAVGMCTGAPPGGG